MGKNPQIFLGVNIVTGSLPFVYAALDSARQIISFNQCVLEELKQFINGQENVLTAINSPSKLNQHLMKQSVIREKLSPVPSGGYWQNLRVVEYQLIQKGIHTNRTPSAISDCPKWMKHGFELYQLLMDLGFLAYPALGVTNIWLETCAEACYWALLGHRPFEARSLEGRLQRQLVLFEHDLQVPDPIDFFEEITRHRMLEGNLPLHTILSQSNLDALVSAYIAWLAGRFPEQITSMGDPQEGILFLPK